MLDKAQREPVTIRRQNREVAVVLSPEDYRRLKGANVEQFQDLCDGIAERAIQALSEHVRVLRLGLEGRVGARFGATSHNRLAG